MAKATSLLVLANMAIFIYLSLGGVAEETILALAFSGDNLSMGRWWVLLTSMFIHGDVFHITLNSLALFFFGKALESRVAMGKYLTIYFAGGVAGSLLSLFFYLPDVPIVGASGAIFAVMGAAMLLKPFELVSFPYVLPLPIALVGVIYSLSNVALLFSSTESNVAYIAHVGGLATGIALGSGEKGGKKGLLVVLGVLAFISLAPVVLSYVIPPDYTVLIRDGLKKWVP